MIMEEPGHDWTRGRAASYRYLVEESRADGLLLATSLRIPGARRRRAAGVASSRYRTCT